MPAKILFTLFAFALFSLCSCGCEPVESSDVKVSESESQVPGKWTEVVSLKGSGDKKSQVFKLSGAKARIRYKFKQSDYGGMFAVYVLKRGEQLLVDGGIPEVMASASEEGESSLEHLRKGEYYIVVMSMGDGWGLVVEEFK